LQSIQAKYLKKPPNRSRLIPWYDAAFFVSCYSKIVKAYSQLFFRRRLYRPYIPLAVAPPESRGPDNAGAGAVLTPVAARAAEAPQAESPQCSR